LRRSEETRRLFRPNWAFNSLISNSDAAVTGGSAPVAAFSARDARGLLQSGGGLVTLRRDDGGFLSGGRKTTDSEAGNDRNFFQRGLFRAPLRRGETCG
jgi:hypothetical protein